MENLAVNKNFWYGKKVLITGHTGFKGSWLSLWLQNMGANIIGVSLDPPTEPSLYKQANIAKGIKDIREDINDIKAIKYIFQQNKPEVVFHLAAQSLVRRSYLDPIETYKTNVMGSLHILEGVRSIDTVRAVIMITTDKCYENREWEWGYRENDPMGGFDPYSSSKGSAELLIASYRSSYYPESSLDSNYFCKMQLVTLPILCYYYTGQIHPLDHFLYTPTPILYFHNTYLL